MGVVGYIQSCRPKTRHVFLVVIAFSAGVTLASFSGLLCVKNPVYTPSNAGSWLVQTFKGAAKKVDLQQVGREVGVTSTSPNQKTLTLSTQRPSKKRLRSKATVKTPQPVLTKQTVNFTESKSSPRLPAKKTLHSTRKLKTPESVLTKHGAKDKKTNSRTSRISTQISAKRTLKPADMIKPLQLGFTRNSSEFSEKIKWVSVGSTLFNRTFWINKLNGEEKKLALKKLHELGYDWTGEHEFKSPYIITPRLYDLIHVIFLFFSN